MPSWTAGSVREAVSVIGDSQNQLQVLALLLVSWLMPYLLLPDSRYSVNSGIVLLSLSRILIAAVSVQFLVALLSEVQQNEQHSKSLGQESLEVEWSAYIEDLLDKAIAMSDGTDGNKWRFEGREHSTEIYSQDMGARFPAFFGKVEASGSPLAATWLQRVGNMSRMWLLLTLLTGAAAQAANEVGLSLSKAAKVSNSASAQAHAEIATMTSELKLKQKQYSSAKVQVEQLIKKEKTLAKHTDQLEHQESRMEERLKAQGSASNKVTLARAQAQALQKKVLSTEAAVATVQQAIRHQQDALKSSEEELQRIKRKEEDFSEGTRLAVMKSNKLEQSLKEARTELQKQKANLTEQHETARAAEARRDHAHHEERDKANAAPSSLESHRGQVKPINAHSINLAEQDVKHAENQLKDAQRQFKELRQQNPEGSAGGIFANLLGPFAR